MGKMSQRKGRGAELELCRLLNEHGIPARPGAAVSFGITPDITGIPGIHPEVKRAERLNIHEAMEQAGRDSRKFKDGVPAVFHRKNRSPWLVTMKLEDLLKKGDEMRDTPYFQIFADVYRLMGAHYPAQDTPEAWAEMLQDVSGIYRKYCETEQAAFVRSLSLAVLNELERNKTHEEK